MTFDFENEKYRYKFAVENTAKGPYVFCSTSCEGWNVSTGLPIINGRVNWLPGNVKALYLTPEAMQYVDRLMQLKVFW